MCKLARPARHMGNPSGEVCVRRSCRPVTPSPSRGRPRARVRCRRRAAFGPLLLLILTVAACVPPAGTGQHAERAFATAAPVIRALEHFRTREGRYPDALAQLSLQDLAAEALLAIDQALGQQAPRGRKQAETSPYLSYQRVDSEYVLVLSYRTRTAVSNLCRYRPSVAAWRCEAYMAAIGGGAVNSREHG